MANCFCIKGHSYDFFIKVIDNQTIVYNDLSRWMEESDSAQYILPETHEVLVTLPDSSVHTINVRPQSSTVLTATDLGISKFTDGIYCFSIDPDSSESGGCGITQTKSTGIFPNIICCMFSAYAKLDDTRHDEIGISEQWLKQAINSSELGMEKQALSEYKIAKRLLDKLNCDCNC